MNYKERLDIVVCSAGTYNPLYSLDDDKYDCEHIDHLINVNLKGTIFAVKTSLPLLKKSSAGRIIIISSITGPHTGFASSSLYGATKSGQVWYSFRDIYSRLSLTLLLVLYTLHKPTTLREEIFADARSKMALICGINLCGWAIFIFIGEKLFEDVEIKTKIFQPQQGLYVYL